VTAGVGSRRLALAVVSQSLADVRAIARAKPKAARVAGGKPYGWGDGVKIESYADCFSAHLRTWFAIDSQSLRFFEHQLPPVITGAKILTLTKIGSSL